MDRRRYLGTAIALGIVALAAAPFAQQVPAGAYAAKPAAAPAPEKTRPALLFRETWKMPPLINNEVDPHNGQPSDANRRVTQLALTNPRLEVKLYGPASKDVGVFNHEGRFDLWNGVATGPIAVTLRDKANFMDLTGLARLRWITRTNALHVLHPVVKLADGTLLVGDHTVNTNGDYLENEVAFDGQRWFRLDPATVVVNIEFKNPNLSKVDEIGWTDLAPGGGHFNAGWTNVSVFEVYAKGIPR